MKTVVLLTLLLALTAAAQPAAEPVPQAISRYEEVLVRRPEPGTAFDRVRAHFQTGPGMEALVDRWTSAHTGAADPKSKAAWATLLGILYQEQGNQQLAAEWFAAALEIDPSLTPTRISLGAMTANAGDFDRAIAILQAGIPNEDPARADPELIRQLALTLERDFRSAEAIALWESVAAQEGADAFTLEEAAEALARNQEYAGARKLYERLAKDSTGDPYQLVRYRIRTARLWEASGDFENALEIYRQAIPKTSGTSWLQKELRNRIEEVYRKQENLPGLAEYYESLLESRGPDSETALLLAAVLDDLGRADEATEWTRKSVEWSPGRTDLALQLAERYRRAQDPGESIKILAPLARSLPDNEAVAEALGEAYWDQFERTEEPADRAAAIREWNRIAPPANATSQAALRVAVILRRHDLADEALAAYARAAEIAPDSVDIREQWADWLFILEQPDEAWNVLEQITKAPGNQTPERYLRLAQLKKRYGNSEGALVSINEGLATAPDFFDLLSLKWSVLAEMERWEDAAGLYPAMASAAPNEFFRKSVDQRHIQALAAAGELESTRIALEQRLESEALTADELGLLLRIAIETREAETAELVIAEIQRRFAQNVSLQEAVFSYFLSQGDSGEALVLLSRLRELDPGRSDEWLQQIATIQLETLRYDEAIQAAEARVALNPAKVDAHLFLADVYLNAGKVDPATDSLRTGIGLAEDPAPIRRKLVEFLSLSGKTDEAYQQTWNLFRESDSLEARLQTVPQLANLALQRGTLDELIRDFERKRMSEDNGYRYALFLASIYESIGDLSSARENLIEALAARPRDKILIQQIVSMAREENNWEDYVRFSRELAQVDPSPDNLFTHLEALLAAERSEEALEWLTEHQEVFLRNIESLRTMALTGSRTSEEVLRVFGRTLRQKDGDAEAQLALAEMLLGTGDFVGAEEALWRVLRMKEPPASQSAPAASASSTRQSHNWYTPGPFAQRLGFSYQARNKAQQIIFARNSSGFRRYVRASGQGTSAPTFAQFQDTALIYLAALAIRQERATEFLQELDRILEQRPDPTREKMIAYALLNETDRTTEAAKALLAEDGLDVSTLDEIQTVLVRNSFGRASLNETEAMDEGLETIALLKEKMFQVDPARAKGLDQLLLHLLSQGNRLEEAKALAEEILEGLEPETHADFQQGFTALYMSGNFERMSDWLRKYLESPAFANSPGASQRHMPIALVYSPLHQQGRGPGSVAPLPEPEAGVEIVLENLRLYWEHITPQAGGSQPNYGRSNDPLTFPGENRWVSNYELHFLQQVASAQTANPEVSKRLSEGLREIAEEREGVDRIPPLITLALWNRLQGDTKETARIAESLADQFPQFPELRLAAARALLAVEDYKSSLEQLQQTRPQTYADQQAHLMIELKCLVALERKQEAEALVKGFFARRNVARSDHQLRSLLQQLNLSEVANRQVRQPSSPVSIASALRSGDWNQINSVMSQMQQLARDDKKEEAYRIAETILAHDPMRVLRNNESHLRDRALNIYLQEDDATSELRATLEAQLDAAPNSAFLHFRLAELALKAKSRNKQSFPYDEHIEKILSLRPNDYAIQTVLAELLASADEKEAAADLYLRILKEDPDTIVKNSNSGVRTLIEVDRVDELLTIIEDPEFVRTIALSNSWTLSNLLRQIANLLENEKRPEDALRFRMIALDHLDWTQRLGQVNEVLDLQIGLGRVTEARETLWKSVFADEGEDARGDESEPQFGFGSSGSAQQSLFSGVSYHSSNFSIRGVEILDYAGRLDLNERILVWLAENRPSWISESDACLIETFVRIHDRDEDWLASLELDALIESIQESPVHNAMIFTILADKLAEWEDARATAIELYSFLVSTPDSALSGPMMHHFQNRSTDILIRNTIALSELARTDGEIEAVREALATAIDSMRIEFAASSGNRLSRHLAVKLLSIAIGQNLLDEAATEQWLQRIRAYSNWGSYAESAASYLQALVSINESALLYPSLDESWAIRPMIATDVDPSNSSRSGSPLLIAPLSPPDPSDLTLYATRSPGEDPVIISSDPSTSAPLSGVLPDGFGWILLAGPGEDPGAATRERWAPVSLLPNLIPEPNPSEAPPLPKSNPGEDSSAPKPKISEDSPSPHKDSPRRRVVLPGQILKRAGTPPIASTLARREGWTTLPADPILTTELSPNAPIQKGNQISATSNFQRSTLVSDPIPVETSKDFLLSGWFNGTNSSGNDGTVRLGLIFLDEDQQEIRTYSEWARMPYEELWVHLATIYAASGSPRKGRFSYSNKTRFVQITLEIDPGVTFGGLHLSALPPVPDAESLDVSKTMNEAASAAREGDGEKAADLFLQALRADPNRATRSWRRNDETWISTIASSPRLGEIFAFLARPDIHNQESFRYYRKAVSSNVNLFALAELAIHNPDVPDSQDFLNTVLTRNTCLRPPQKDLLHLQARAASIFDGQPADDLQLARRTLGLAQSENQSPYVPSAAKWQDALLLLAQIDALGPLEASFAKPEPSAPEPDELLVRAWIAAESHPAQAAQLLEDLAGANLILSEPQVQRTTIVLGRMAATAEGIAPARNALRTLSKSLPGDEADQAKFRFEALTRLSEAQSEPSPELEEAVRVAEIEWFSLDPSPNASRIRDLLVSLVAAQDFQTAQKIVEATSEKVDLASVLNRYHHIFPRLIQPDPEALWPVAVAGPPDAEGVRTVLFRFHPNNNFAPDFFKGGSPQLTAAPVIDTLPGLDRLEIQFGPFPLELETIAEVTGKPASGEVTLELPSANGFLRAVAFVGGREVSGPLTLVTDGDPIAIGHGLPETDSPSPFPPPAAEFVSIEKSLRIDPDFSAADPSRQDLILTAWITSQDGTRFVSTYPRHPQYDSNAPNRTATRVGEFTLFSSLIPGESGKKTLEPIERIDLRIPSRMQMADVRLIAVNRSDFEYLSWLGEVREMAARIRAGEEILSAEVIALASRDPYGSAPYLLEAVIEAILKSGTPEEAVAYLQALDPTDASPFHQNSRYHTSLHRSLRDISGSDSFPDDVRWEAALVILRLADMDSLNRINDLYNAAGSHPDRLPFARQQLLDWINGTDLPQHLADHDLRQEITRVSTSNSVPTNQLIRLLRRDYDSEIDEFLRRRLAEINMKLENESDKQFIIATLRSDPLPLPDLEDLLAEVLTSRENSWNKAFAAALGTQNLKVRGMPPEEREALLVQALSHLLEKSPLENQYDPARGPLTLAAEILRNNESPPTKLMIETAIWITQAAPNKRTQPYSLCSESAFLLIDFLKEKNQSQIRDDLLAAIRKAAKESRYEKNLNTRYP